MSAFRPNNVSCVSDERFLIVKGVLLASVQSYAVQKLPHGNFLSRRVQPIKPYSLIGLIPSDP